MRQNNTNSRTHNIFVLLVCVVALGLIGIGLHDRPAAASPSAPLQKTALVAQPSHRKPAPRPEQNSKQSPIELSFGGRTVIPSYRFVALYGVPNQPALGALGDQPMDATIDRAKTVAASYQQYSAEPVIPALEIITTIASSAPTSNGDYSTETDPAALLPWIQAAAKAKEYVVLDLQPGRSDFLTQAKEYASLLKNPNVGLALDPEWRLKPDQLPAVKIGSVDIGEINQTTDWLADLTMENHLPQKLFLLHQFRLDMITDREELNTAHPDLAYVIQMDGNGSQPQKQDTWKTITQGAPEGVRFGWKNFYTVDHPMLDPAGTMAHDPKPWYVSYQ